MGARHIVGVQPDITGIGEVEGEHVILGIVLSYINVVAVRADVVQRLADRRARAALGPFGFVIAGSSFSAGTVVSLHKTAVFQLLADLREVPLIGGKIQRCPDALQMPDL